MIQLSKSKIRTIFEPLAFVASRRRCLMKLNLSVGRRSVYLPSGLPRDSATFNEKYSRSEFPNARSLNAKGEVIEKPQARDSWLKPEV
jgi:hypothetical protein